MNHHLSFIRVAVKEKRKEKKKDKQKRNYPGTGHATGAGFRVS